jgi:hypothetical protein
MRVVSETFFLNGKNSSEMNSMAYLTSPLQSAAKLLNYFYFSDLLLYNK